MSWLLPDRHQLGVLSDRYLDTLLGDFGGLFLGLIQAPLLALAIGAVFQNLSHDTLTLYFVLCLSAFFLGAVNASREIVKERPLFLREKMFNLSVPSYLVSKLGVQLIFVLYQSVLLSLVPRIWVSLQVNPVGVAAVLALVSLAGTSTGLLISAAVSTTDRAVALVPLVVIPQILFSEVVIGARKLENWTGWAEKAMPVRWGYEMMKDLRARTIEWADVAGEALMILALAALCHVLALILLRRARYA